MNTTKTMCPHCNRETLANAPYCAHCGNTIQLECHVCHAPYTLPLTEKYCPHCAVEWPVNGQKRIMRRQRIQKIKAYLCSNSSDPFSPRVIHA